jgi:hypothetical protein
MGRFVFTPDCFLVGYRCSPLYTRRHNKDKVPHGSITADAYVILAGSPAIYEIKKILSKRPGLSHVPGIDSLHELNSHKTMMTPAEYIAQATACVRVR